VKILNITTALDENYQTVLRITLDLPMMIDDGIFEDMQDDDKENLVHGLGVELVEKIGEYLENLNAEPNNN
jgi:uncharacterized protein YaaW (UPF0174 family)